MDTLNDHIAASFAAPLPPPPGRSTVACSLLVISILPAPIFPNGGQPVGERFGRSPTASSQADHMPAAWRRPAPAG
jgi:hypothetical protein